MVQTESISGVYLLLLVWDSRYWYCMAQFFCLFKRYNALPLMVVCDLWMCRWRYFAFFEKKISWKNIGICVWCCKNSTFLTSDWMDWHVHLWHHSLVQGRNITGSDYYLFLLHVSNTVAKCPVWVQGAVEWVDPFPGQMACEALNWTFRGFSFIRLVFAFVSVF